MVMEDRISKLEGAYEQTSQRLSELRLELARLNNRMDNMQAETTRQFKEQNDRFEARIEKMQEETARQIKEQGDRFEARIEKMQEDMTRQFEKMNDKIDAQNDKIDVQNRDNNLRIDSLNRVMIWGTGLMLTAVLGALGLGLGLGFA